ncbi:MAG TPA: hypothetical protein VFP43_10550 [Mesorhizobium sp.]|nr:hypothetical protein [Mesorhizobium sp.]
MAKSAPTRFTLGANLLEHAQPFPAHRRLKVLKSSDIAARSGKTRDKPAVHRLGHLSEHDRDLPVQSVKLGKGQIARSNDHIRCGLNQFRRKGLDLSGPNIAGVIPAQITKRLAEGREASLSRFVSLRVRREKNTNAPHARAPLRARRAACRRAAEEANEFPPSHSRSRRKSSGSSVLKFSFGYAATFIEPSRLSTITGEWRYSICGGAPYLPSTNFFHSAV